MPVCKQREVRTGEGKIEDARRKGLFWGKKSQMGSRPQRLAFERMRESLLPV